jgi:hypothetical protein
MITLGQLKQGPVSNVAGVNVNDPQFVQYVNEAVQNLMDLSTASSRGWLGTIQAIEGTSYDGCFVWPANVISVLGVKTECHGTLNISNSWYSYVRPKKVHYDMINKWQGNPTVEFEGQTCLFRSIKDVPTQILALCDNVADVGKTITIYGKDYQGKELFSTYNGNTQRGLVLTLGQSATSSNISPTAISVVTDIAKNITIGSVRLFAYSPSQINDEIAYYSAGDVNPKFLYSRLVHGRAKYPFKVEALVKIGFSGVSADADIIPIDCESAIKSMVQSIRSREAGEVEIADAHEKTALRRLANQANSRFQLEQVAVSVKAFGNRGTTTITSMI